MAAGSDDITRPLSAALASELLDIGKDLRVRVTGVSMKPFLKTGDVVTIRKTPVTALRAGDIVFCRNDAQTMSLHRLLKIQKQSSSGGMILYTKGDAVNRMDLPLGSDRCLGKAVFIERAGPDGKAALVDLESRDARMANRFLAGYYRFRVIVIGYVTKIRNVLGN